MKTLYKFHFDCGRNGMLTGLFIASSEELSELVKSGQEIYFGEVLGKHSEVKGPIELCDFTEVTTDPEVISMVEKYKLEFGYDPIGYARDQRNQESEE